MQEVKIRGGNRYKIKVSTTIPIEMFDYCKRTGMTYARVIEQTWEYIDTESPMVMKERIGKLAKKIDELNHKIWGIEKGEV